MINCSFIHANSLLKLRYLKSVLNIFLGSITVLFKLVQIFFQDQQFFYLDGYQLVSGCMLGGFIMVTAASTENPNTSQNSFLNSLFPCMVSYL